MSVGLVLAIGLSPQGSSAATQGDATAPDNGFSAAGPWNTPLPADVPLAPNSQAIVNNLVQDKQNNSGLWAINTDTYSAPVYTVGPDTPVQQWTYSDCQNMPQLAPVIAGSLAAVPTPPGMLVSQGTDESVAIYQPATDTYWDFWRAQQDASGHWSACWGGEIEHYSTNPGIFDNPLGASATGLPLGASLIRVDELRRGRIDHAINLETVRTQAGCFSWPATRDDGNTPGADIPCEGQRFRLDPAFDVNTLIDPAARTIARAMQQYGLILTDKAGAVVTQAEDPRPFEATDGGIDPYNQLFDPTGTGLLPESLTRYLVMAQIPLNRLQALPLNYGESGF
ncbi:MAG TPA: hypothetical protein VGS97_16500 [Actinocrinis sp.]|uniref:hypothetical protein n=1 Tax=Actinocrinis sp. TaxID=1920516 RepID=UPI002DDD40AD|nr:hypothetical protein [Actinocrinis sp.]HEV2345701.1 hypothetical protein [Actinocrinis sp.]